MCALALTRDQGRLRRKKVLGKGGNGVNQFIHPGSSCAGDEMNLPSVTEVGSNSFLGLRISKVHFVNHKPRRRNFRLATLRRGRVNNPEDEVRTGRLFARPAYSLALNGVA